MTSHFRNLFILFVLFFGLSGCKKDNNKTASITVTVNNTDPLSVQLMATIHNIDTKNITEAGFAWGKKAMPTKENSFVKVISDISSNFDFKIATGLSPDSTYYARAYLVTKDKEVLYSQEINFKGKEGNEIVFQTNLSEYTWEDQVELQISNDKDVDLRDLKFTIDGTFPLDSLKIVGNRIYFKIPLAANPASPYRNLVYSTIDIELYGTPIRNLPIRFKIPKIDESKEIYGTVGETILLTGSNFHPLKERNTVLFGANKFVVLNATKTTLEVQIPDTEFSYSSKITVQTGPELKVSTEASAKIYKHFKRIAPFPGPARIFPLVFEANDKLYIGLGSGHFSGILQDMWEFTPATNSWKQIADLPIVPVVPKAMVIAGKIFVVPANQSANYIYYYESNSNTWKKMQDYPNYPLMGMSAFASDRYGYLLSGYIYDSRNYQVVFDYIMRYDPLNNNWKNIENFPGVPRGGANTMKIGNKIILFGGDSYRSNEPRYPSDCWSFDLTSEKWTRLKNLIPVVSSPQFNFAVGGKGYIGSAIFGTNNQTSELIEYDPVIDSYRKIDNILDQNKIYAGAATVGNTGYILCGDSQSGNRGTNVILKFIP